ncbi:MAG: SGNH/GDSL hydrolase family protein [Methylocystis sp.]
MKHPKTIKAVAFLIVAAFTIFCSEIALRIANAYFPQPFFYSKHLYRFRAKPFQNFYGFTTNSHGFNDIEHDKEKSPGNYRILSVGDSFVFGVVPYEFNYNTILSRLLRESGYNAEVINMGIPGAAPRNYYTILETEGSALHPDLVIVSFFIGNDFEAVDQVRSWQSYSFVVSLLKYIGDVAGKTNLTPWSVGEVYDDSKKSFTDEDYDILEMKRSWVFKKDNPLYKKMYDMTLNDIKLIRELCKKLNSKLLIAIIPDELQINLALRNRALSLAHSSEDAFDFEQPNRMLAGSLTDLGITYIDLLPALRQESESKAVYKPNDSHWNLKGNAVAAHELSAFLRENSLVLGR